MWKGYFQSNRSSFLLRLISKKFDWIKNNRWLHSFFGRKIAHKNQWALLRWRLSKLGSTIKRAIVFSFSQPMPGGTENSNHAGWSHENSWYRFGRPNIIILNNIESSWNIWDSGSPEKTAQRIIYSKFLVWRSCRKTPLSLTPDNKITMPFTSDGIG